MLVKTNKSNTKHITNSADYQKERSMKFKQVMASMLTAAMVLGNAPLQLMAEETAEFTLVEEEPVQEQAAAEDAAAEEVFDEEDSLFTAEDVLLEEEISEVFTDEAAEDVLEEETDESDVELNFADGLIEEEDGAEAASEAVYVLMNIPYSVYYAAQGISGVDAVSSSTHNKPRTGGLAGGSYHKNTDGSDISGITYPVKVSSLEDLAGYTQITEESSVDITVTNRGQTATTTYKGKDALFESADYAYYVLTGEAPAAYMELKKAEDGAVTFTAVQAEATRVEGAEGKVSYYARHANIEIVLSGTTGVAQGDAVSAVIVTTDDGKQYGLRHVVNIWRGTEIGWNVSDAYDIDGKTITNIRYIKTDAVIDYPVSIPVKKMAEAPALTQDGAVLNVAGLPEDAANAVAAVSYTTGSGREAKTTVVAENIPVTEGKLELPKDLTADQVYNVVLSADNYAFATATFTYAAEAQTEKPQEETEAPQKESEKPQETEAPQKESEKPQAETEEVKKERLRAKVTKTQKTSITLKWNKIKNADGYIVYGAKAGTKTLKQIADVKKTGYTQKKLKKGTYYTYKVEAYKLVNDQKVTVSDTNAVYAVTAGGKKTNVKSIKLNKKKVTLRKGKKFTLKVKTTSAAKNLKTKKYAALRYESSNTAVAKVSAKGKITAVSKGSCTVYVTTQEGVYATVKVTVK